jgi:DNA-binding MarR family transcriptional regulator
MRPLRSSDYSSLASFRYALRKFLRFSKELLLREAELTPEQYEALLALRAFSSADGMQVGELSERLQVKQHTTVALTNRLVARKLVTKRRGQPDRRHIDVKLTEEGTTLLATLARLHFRDLRTHSPEIMRALQHIQNS